MADNSTTIEVTDEQPTTGEQTPSDNRLRERELMELHAGAVKDAYGLMGAIARKANDQNGEILSSLAQTYCNIFNAVSDTVKVSTGTTLAESLFAPPVAPVSVSEPKGVETTDSELDPSDTAGGGKAKRGGKP